MEAVIWAAGIGMLAGVITARLHRRPPGPTLLVGMIGALAGSLTGVTIGANLGDGPLGIRWEALGIGLGAAAGALIAVGLEPRPHHRSPPPDPSLGSRENG